MDGPRADRGGLPPQPGADHRPGFRLSCPSRIFRVDQPPPCTRAPARLRDLAAGAAVPQQHLAGADGGSCHVRGHFSVADVPALAAPSAGCVQQLHMQPRVRPQGRLLGQGRDSRGLALLLEGVLHVRKAVLGEVGLSTSLWRFAQLARLRVHAHEPVQPDQALGMGRHRCPICPGPSLQASGDSAAPAHPTFSELVPQPPQLDLSAAVADVRSVRADLGQPGLRAHRSGPEPVVLVGRPAVHDPLDGDLLHLFRDVDPAAQAGRLALLEKGRRPFPVPGLSDRWPGPQRVAGAGGAHATSARPLPGVQSYREGVMRMDETGARTVANTVGGLFHEVHKGIREQVEGVDGEALNWKPHPNANSVAVLVVHTLGSEREMIRAVRLLSTERDRPAEFKAEADAADLLALLDRADRELDEHVAAITGADLTEMRPRGDRPPRPGLEWLVANYGHAREHLAQIQLTRQLHGAR